MYAIMGMMVNVIAENQNLGCWLKLHRDPGDLVRDYMVGDRSKDIDAGKASGCQTYAIEYSYCEPLSNLPDFGTDNLKNAAKWILQQAPIWAAILTTFNESHHLDRILQDLSKQSYPDEKLELLVLEAGKKMRLEFMNNWENGKIYDTTMFLASLAQPRSTSW